MDIVVLIKQVPDTTEVRLDRKTGNLIREGVDQKDHGPRCQGDA